MTVLLFLGLIRSDAAPLDGLPDHVAICTSVGTGLATRVDPAGADQPDVAGEWIRLQHMILCGYAEVVDILPVAPGALFSSSTALRAHVNERPREFREALDKVAGLARYDLALRIREDATDRRPDRTAATTGRAFLKARRDARDARQHASASGVDAGLALDRVLRDAEGVTVRLQQADQARPWRRMILAPRAAVPLLTGRLAAGATAAESCGLNLSLVGPLPPFGFVSDGALSHA